MSAIDLDAYFARIGYDGPRTPTLATLNAIASAHARSIPFENLDVLLGQPIRLDSLSLQQKLVRECRGGYCFEQNGLLLLVLESLGYQVAPISARVRLERPRDFTPPRTHVFLRAEIDNESWLADVGVGGLSLTSTLRLAIDLEQSTPHETRRLIREGDRIFHQARLGREWADVCEFTLEEMPAIDRDVANWFTSAHPQSHFKNRLVVARAAPGGERLSVLNDEFTMRQPGGVATTHHIDSPSELLDILARHFSLTFPAGTRFGPPGSAWPA